MKCLDTAQTVTTSALGPLRVDRLPPGYFPINVALLKRMASSQRLALKVRAGDLTMVDFIPMQETRAALEQFINDRGLAND